MPTGAVAGEVTCKTAVVLARGSSVTYEGLIDAVQPGGLDGGARVKRNDTALHAVVS